MEFLDELEGMVRNTTALVSSEIPQRDIDRWQRLFALSHSEAQSAIETYRLDLSRRHIPDDLWTFLEPDLEERGFDREAYAYSLTLAHRGIQPVDSAKSSNSAAQRGARVGGRFLAKLNGPISTAAKIQEIGSLSVTPDIVKAHGADDKQGEEEKATFAIIDLPTRQLLLNHLSQHHPHFRPTIVHLSESPKSLSPHSPAPTIGVDSTLPQHRLTTVPCAAGGTTEYRPAQDEYPVWYFFYGTLRCPSVLERVLPKYTAEERRWVRAYVVGGRVKGWGGGKYKALVDDLSSRGRGYGSAGDGRSDVDGGYSGGARKADAFVHGDAFVVFSKEEEDALRFYEGEMYEVVRCEIWFDELRGRDDWDEKYERSMHGDGDGTEMVKGLTFRFAGAERDLDQN